MTGIGIPPLEFLLQTQPGVTPGYGFLYILIFLLPGIIFVKAVRIGEQKIDDISRLDKLAYALAGSGVSLIPIFGVLSFLGYGPIRLTTLPFLPALTLLGFVIFHSVVAGMLGFGWGTILNSRRDEQKTKTYEDREQPWQYIGDKILQERVWVITNDGKELRGVVSRYGSGGDQGDLTIGSPTFIRRKQGEVTLEYSLGNEAYLSKSAIGQIHYRDDEYIVDDSAESVPDEDGEDNSDKKKDDGS